MIPSSARHENSRDDRRPTQRRLGFSEPGVAGDGGRLVKARDRDLFAADPTSVSPARVAYALAACLPYEAPTNPGFVSTGVWPFEMSLTSQVRILRTTTTVGDQVSSLVIFTLAPVRGAWTMSSLPM